MNLLCKGRQYDNPHCTADSSDITSVGILLGNNEFDASINGNQIVVSKTITQDDVMVFSVTLNLKFEQKTLLLAML